MDCPKCKSDNVVMLSASYPRSYECKNCGKVFLKTPNAFIDE